jgi:hypothetical protein
MKTKTISYGSQRMEIPTDHFEDFLAAIQRRVPDGAVAKEICGLELTVRESAQSYGVEYFRAQHNGCLAVF